MSSFPVLVILIPLGGAFLVSLVQLLLPRLVKPLLIAVALAQGLVSAALVTAVARSGAVSHHLGGWPAPVGIALVVDELSALFLAVAGIGMPLTLLYLTATSRTSPGKTAVLLCLYAAATAGQTVTGDLFNLFVFIELTTVVTIGLIARKGTGVSAAHAFHYLLYASLSGLFLLLAIVLLYRATGTLDLARIAALGPDLPPRVAALALASVMVAFGIKIALVPLHLWQPGAYAAAGSSVAAALSGVGMTVSTYALVRLVWSLGGGNDVPGLVLRVLLVGGCVNVLVGHVLGLVQRDIRRMLAFSSVAHAGYILMGLGLGTAAGLAAGMLHAANHAIMKMAAFWSGRALMQHASTPWIPRLQGVAYAAPGWFALFMVATLALVGIPPFHGFASKALLARASLDQGLDLPVVVIAVGTAISLAYYARLYVVALRIPRRPRAPPPASPGRWAAGLIVAVLCLACLALGFATPAVMPALDRAAIRAFGLPAAVGHPRSETTPRSAPDPFGPEAP